MVLKLHVILIIDFYLVIFNSMNVLKYLLKTIMQIDHDCQIILAL